jgi:hypothetical protein
MYRIIYLSSATNILTKEEINYLLVKSKSYNIKSNITGLLIYIDGDFLQVIEGEKEEVITLFELIKTDKRHKHVITVFKAEVTERQFPNWSMGFSKTNYEELQKMEGFQSIDKKKLSNISDKMAVTFINTFTKSHRNEIVFT